MRRALAEDFASLPATEVVMTLDERFPDEPGPWRITRVGPGQERGTFEHLASEVDAVVLIAPETGGLLRERADWIEQAGSRSLGSSPEAIALAGDKAALGTDWRRLGIPSPEGQVVRLSEGLPLDFPYPAVLKPIDGAGSVSTFLIESPESLSPAMIEELPKALLQPFIQGVPLSAAFLVGRCSESGQRDARLIGIGRQGLEIQGVRFVYRGGCVPERVDVPLSWLWRALEAVPGLAGWVGLDFLWDESREALTMIELNPRLTTSYNGWRCLFPRGFLAGQWLQAIEEPSRFSSDPEPWTDQLASPPCVQFSTDGSIDLIDSPSPRSQIWS